MVIYPSYISLPEGKSHSIPVNPTKIPLNPIRIQFNPTRIPWKSHEILLKIEMFHSLEDTLDGRLPLDLNSACNSPDMRLSRLSKASRALRRTSRSEDQGDYNGRFKLIQWWSWFLWSAYMHSYNIWLWVILHITYPDWFNDDHAFLGLYAYIVQLYDYGHVYVSCVYVYIYIMITVYYY